MIKKHSTILALTGVALLAAGQVHAANTYSAGDLLLDFRTATSTPGTTDVTVDEGNVSTFVTQAANDGGTVVLDNGGTYSATAGLQASSFSGASLISLLGTPASGNPVGFSAAAVVGGTTLFLSRAQSSASLTPPATHSQQQAASTQNLTGTDIASIGLETESAGATTLNGSSANAEEYSSSDAHSYQAEGEAAATTPNIISYKGSQNTVAGAGGLIESLQTGSGNIYEALWEVPPTGAGSDTYEGYFTFKPDGEVDFTTTAAAVPEVPATGMIAGVGMLVAAARRQFASRKA